MIIAVGTSLAPHAGTLALQACSTIMTTLSVALANRLGAAVFAEKACEKLPSGEAEEYKLSKLSIKTVSSRDITSLLDLWGRDCREFAWSSRDRVAQPTKEELTKIKFRLAGVAKLVLTQKNFIS